MAVGRLYLLLTLCWRAQAVGRGTGEHIAVEIGSHGTVSGQNRAPRQRTMRRMPPVDEEPPPTEEPLSNEELPGLKADEPMHEPPEPTGEEPKQVNTECWRLLRKARDIIEFDIKTRKDQSLPAFNFQEQTVRELDIPADGHVTNTVIRHLEASLGSVSLARALQWGSVWSVDDQDALHKHCMGEARAPLEENKFTDTGDVIVQGDMVSARCDERLIGDGAGYRGCQTRTRSGLRCQHWDAQAPHSHAWTPDMHVEHDLAANFCRNPNGQNSIWCFTVSEDRRWEHCDPLPEEETNLTDPSEPSTSKGLWTSGTVRYCYDQEINLVAKVAVDRVMRSMHKQVPCLNFKLIQQKDKLNCEEMPSVLIKSTADGCWSHVGQVSGFEERFKCRSQLLNLGPGCEVQGMVAHQVGQMLGLRHEVSRADRDLHINFFENNMDGPVNVLAPISLTANLPSVASAARDFDLLSLMMSGPHSFTQNGSKTLEPKVEPLLRRYLGQRLGFSHLDVLRLADMYGCLEGAVPESPSKHLSELFLQGNGMLADDVCKDEGYTGVTYVDGSGIPKPYWCGDLALKCLDSDIGARIRKRCPRTCLMCTPSMSGHLVSTPREEAPEPKVQEVTALLVSTTPCLNLSANLTEAVAIHQNASDEIIPPDDCQDAAFTGFKFRSGREAVCGDLEAFCDHRVLGKQARQACPKTCGLCGGEVDISGVSSDPNTPENCRDQHKDDAPVFTLAGKPAACPDLTGYCQGHEDSFLVVEKCKLSCKACNPNGQSTPTTTATYTFSTSVTDSYSRSATCSRRRRWGFCATRRRRLG